MSKSKNQNPSDFVKEGVGYNDITLSRPASVGGAQVSSIRMREPIVADQENYQDAGRTEAAREITTFANLCEIAPDDIRKLPLRDYARLQASFTLFTN
jgi:hypothetical protein